MKASIDIGTNTVLLLVADVKGKSLTVIEEQQRIPRLGAGVDEQGYFSDESIDRVISSLAEFRKILEEKYPEIQPNQVLVTGTSAVRDAKNRNVLIDLAKFKTGFNINVLSGEEEAKYTFWGAQSVLDNTEGPKLVIDIGGGSTELAYGQNQLREHFSYDMGCVRFTERFLQNNPPKKLEIEQCRNAINETLKEYEFNIPDQTALIGVAGTVTSLAFIEMGLSSYDSEQLSGYVIKRKDITKYIEQFSRLTFDNIAQKYPEVMKGRGDIFLAGLLILDQFMKRYDFDKLITSTGGIRHGTLIGKQDK